MSERVIIAVTPATLTMLERIRDKQDGADPEPCFIDSETPCSHCRETAQYVQEVSHGEFICTDCWGA